MKLHLVKDPDPRLRKICAEVGTIDDKVIELAGAMADYIRHWRETAKENTVIPVGLAAPQVGHLVQLFVICTPQFEATIINPRIVKNSGTRRVAEGCMSLPGRVFIVDRPKVVKVSGLGLDGKPRSVKGHDFLAQTLMHEVEHLQGIMVDNIALGEVPQEMLKK